MNLLQYFLENDGLPIHKNVHVFHAYERHFAPYVSRPVLMFEIGTGGGGSARMFKRYLGPLAIVVSLDNNPEKATLEDDEVKIRIGDQQDTVFLGELLDEFGAPDIVIDDGCHVADYVTKSFRYLYPRMAHSGVYVVEAVNTSYWGNFGGGFRKPGSFIELCKDLIDELNAAHTLGMLPPTQFTQSTTSMHFYDSIVVFERGRQLDKRSLITGNAQSY